MPAAPYISGLATLIYDNLGNPSDISTSSIQTKLTSDGFLGKLNAQISTTYLIASGDITPELGNSEQSIYSQMYQSEYYTRKIMSIAGGTDISWTSIQDGDSRITRSSQTETAKMFKDMKRLADEELIRLIGSYRVNASTPSTIQYASPPIN